MINDEQRKRRKNGIFSSDAPRIMMGDGVRVYLEKVGELEEQDIGELDYVQLGNLIEPRIIDAVEPKFAGELVRSPDTILLEGYPWLGAHCDALSPEYVVEAKAVGSYNRRFWGEPGSDEVPDRVLWQVQEQMLVTGREAAQVPVAFMTEQTLAALILGQPLPIEIYIVPASKILQREILAQCGQLWDHVGRRVPPEPFKIEDARLLYESDRGTLLQATPELLRDLQLLAIHKQTADVAEESIEAVRADIQLAMKKHSEIRHHGQALVSWRRSIDTEIVDADRLEKEFPEVYRQVLKLKKGSRRFLPNWEAIRNLNQPKELTHADTGTGNETAAGAGQSTAES